MGFRSVSGAASIWRSSAARHFHSGSLHRGPAQRRALDRDRHFRLVAGRGSDEHFSALAGGFALGIMMIPITVRSTEEFLRAVPGIIARRRNGVGRE